MYQWWVYTVQCVHILCILYHYLPTHPLFISHCLCRIPALSLYCRLPPKHCWFHLLSHGLRLCPCPLHCPVFSLLSLRLTAACSTCSLSHPFPSYLLLFSISYCRLCSSLLWVCPPCQLYMIVCPLRLLHSSIVIIAPFSFVFFLPIFPYVRPVAIAFICHQRTTRMRRWKPAESRTGREEEAEWITGGHTSISARRSVFSPRLVR